MVWTCHRDFSDMCYTLSDRHHGGEALPTKKDAYHVQDGKMVEMVQCLEHVVNFLWRNDVRICSVFLGLYHVEGRMIPALQLSVDGATDGLHNTCKEYPK